MDINEIMNIAQGLVTNDVNGRTKERKRKYKEQLLTPITLVTKERDLDILDRIAMQKVLRNRKKNRYRKREGLNPDIDQDQEGIFDSININIQDVDYEEKQA